MRKWGSTTFRTALDEENGRKNKKFRIVTKIPETLDWERGDREIMTLKATQNIG
jgi:hypothetical protein